MKLNGVMIGTEKPKVLGEFYTKILGQPGWQEGDMYGFGLGNGSIMVMPHSEVKGASQNPERLIIALETEDVPTEFDRIKSLGAKVVAEPYQPSKDQPEVWLATVADPDNNYLQLATPWND